MIDFERRKEKNIFNSLVQREESILSTEQSKLLYEITIKNDNKIKKLEKDINIIKPQIYDIYDILNQLKNGSLNNDIIYKEEKMYNFNDINILKNELLDYINIEIKKQLKEHFKPMNNQNINNNDCINNKNISKKKRNKDVFNYEDSIKNINKQLLEHKNSIISLELNKLDKKDFNDQIILINNNIDRFNNMNITYNNTNDNINEDDINEKKYIFNRVDINKIKNEIINQFEKVNLKILNELKNQASDIKSLYQEIQNLSSKSLKSNFNTINNDFNDETIDNIEKNLNLENIYYNINKMTNLLNSIEEELSKKVNLEQLNYALKTQGKLNEVLTSSSKICRLFWNSEDVLEKNKYIKWSTQNINTALDVFKWDGNSEIITILQKGIYKIVIGLIGLENNKNIVIIFDDNPIDKKKLIANDNINIDYNNNYLVGKGIVKTIECYIKCFENTEIKIAIFDDKNNSKDFSEEAFIELKKII